MSIINKLSYFFVLSIITWGDARFQVIREWKFLNFTWPNENTLDSAIHNGLYIPENNILAGVKYFEDYYYLTLPRMKTGVPTTLARILAGHTNQTAPLLEPFPSWGMNAPDDCNSLQNVQNVEIDKKGQMWIIDGGRRDTLSPHPVTKCAPKLIIFDIKKNVSNVVYEFPENVASRNGSFLFDIVVDDTDGKFAYITDNSIGDPGIIVYFLKQNKSWKIRHSQAMKADPAAIPFRVNDITISSPINIAGIALGPKVHTTNDKLVVDFDREVYFSPLSSFHLYSINTSVLKNEGNSHESGEYQGEIRDLGIKGSQSGAMIMDNVGTLYYNLLGWNSISKWNSQTSFQSSQKLIAKDDKHLQWTSSFTFDVNGNLTVTSNRLHKFIYDKLDINEYNFRLITSYVGGKSYIYDDMYSYESNSSTTEQTYHVYGSTTGPLVDTSSTNSVSDHSQTNEVPLPLISTPSTTKNESLFDNEIKPHTGAISVNHGEGTSSAWKMSSNFILVLLPYFLFS